MHMGSRTYIPKLVSLLTVICIYITRYRGTLERYLTTDAQKDALTGVAVACELFVSLAPGNTGD